MAPEGVVIALSASLVYIKNNHARDMETEDFHELYSGGFCPFIISDKMRM